MFVIILTKAFYSRVIIMKISRKSLLLISGLLMLNLTTVVASADTTQVDRYLVVANQPLAAQSNLLTQTFQVRFPYTINTIGAAIHYLLRFSGYSLVEGRYQTTEVAAVLARPLPEINRNFGPMTLQTGLMTLIGKPFGLLLDPVHRLLDFRLLPDYQKLYGPAHYHYSMTIPIRN